MDPVTRHALPPDAAFDGGELDCGNGLLLLIRKHIDPLPRGGLLEVRSTEISVDEDLPAWCRMTRNELVSWTRQGRQRSFLVAKGALGIHHGVHGSPFDPGSGVGICRPARLACALGQQACGDH